MRSAGIRAALGIALATAVLLAGARHPARAKGVPSPSAVPSSSPPITPSSSPSITPSSAVLAPPAAGPSDADRKDAGRAFAVGEEAFAKGDFLRAAASFEEAFARAPHDSSLWNAARSWHRAGELDRAANRYAHFLLDAPATAPDRDAATRALREVAAKLGRFEVHAPGLTEVRVDGAPARLPTVYVHPGAHVITGRSGDRTIVRTERVEAGSVTSVVLHDEPPPAVPARSAGATSGPTAASASTAGPTAGPASGLPVPPMAARIGMIVGGTLSVAMIGFTIASGMDTLSAQRRYELTPTREGQVDLADKQRRTFALLGGTIGIVTLTCAAIVWVAVAPPSQGKPPAATLGVRGTF